MSSIFVFHEEREPSACEVFVQLRCVFLAGSFGITGDDAQFKWIVLHIYVEGCALSIVRFLWCSCFLQLVCIVDEG